jgi:hypothetical protein
MAAATLTEQVAPVDQPEVKAVITPVAPAEKQQHQEPVHQAGQQHKAALAVVLRAAKRFNVEARLESLRRYYAKVRAWVWVWIEELLEVRVRWFELEGGLNIRMATCRATVVAIECCVMYIHMLGLVAVS